MEPKEIITALIDNNKISANTIKGLVHCFKDILDDYTKFTANTISAIDKCDYDKKVDMLQKCIVGIGNIIVNKIEKAKGFTKDYEKNIKNIEI